MGNSGDFFTTFAADGLLVLVLSIAIGIIGLIIVIAILYSIIWHGVRRGMREYYREVQRNTPVVDGQRTQPLSQVPPAGGFPWS